MSVRPGKAIEAGEVIVADDDGVVALRREEAADVMDAAEERLANEEAKRQRLASGEPGLDLCDMRPRLAEKGVRYV